MAENILHDFEDQLPGGVTLLPSKGGVFEVKLNGEQLHSKKATGSFPEDGQIEGLLESKLAD